MYEVESMDKLICIGKNYLEHARELGDAVSDSPILFIKPPSVVLQVSRSDLQGQRVEVVLPQKRGSVHHECEIVLRLDRFGVPDAVTLGLDLTLRELQSELKKKGHPWEVSKVFAHSGVVGPWIPLSVFPDYLEERFEFWIDGTLRQSGRGVEMRYSPEICLQYAQECFPICEGDLLFTGTPAGVGSLMEGQKGVLRWGSILEFQVDFK
jgi:2-keto-4-pentenoate hydratase/2-oxohepta-3-ene-1,7-dioic acid hydratase in catechol pathway